MSSASSAVAEIIVDDVRVAPFNYRPTLTASKSIDLPILVRKLEGFARNVDLPLLMDIYENYNNTIN
ncbi:hypothetical protein LSTR_LSTR003060 [Laodelphax striatellus]|uniref:Uncharacterized protein n=1 Tax=Laodelphax striatellus TaxID=195883 RepID=A0A482WVJ5_LAOST|nr:hypothetical protein LSTR_LSTR003060 [Laodelphax striatellus]